jgi:hypothetical protein
VINLKLLGRWDSRCPSTLQVATVMQLVGARRYAVWTLCLTVIALDLGQRSHEIGWHAAGDRILLTIGGLALAKLFSFRLL